MTAVLSIGIAKGGVGKTTTAANLAVALGQRGLSVLVVDLDPQGNLTSAFGLDGKKKVGEYGTSADLLYSPIRRPLSECVIPDVAPGVDIVRSDEQALYLADDDLRRAIAAESKLARALRAADGVWNWVVLDLPPALKGPVVVNAFVASDWVMSPVTPSGWAAKGAARVMAAVDEIRAEELGNPRYLGVVWNRVLPGRTSQEFVMEQVKELAHDPSLPTIPILKTQIPNRQAAEDAEVLGLPAASEPDSDLGEAYRDLAAELMLATGASSEGVGATWRERVQEKKAAKAEKSKKKGKKKKGKAA
jgi:chromosome partitioning protein